MNNISKDIIVLPKGPRIKALWKYINKNKKEEENVGKKRGVSKEELNEAAQSLFYLGNGGEGVVGERTDTGIRTQVDEIS